MAWRRTSRYWVARKLARILFTLICRSCRVRVHGSAGLAAIGAQTPRIYVFWHRHLFYLVYHFRASGVTPLVSLSDDGELIAQIAAEFGMRPVRGSSSRGGAMAFLRLLRLLKEERRTLLITADGPKGPARELKAGTIELARRAGAALIPVSWAARPAKIFSRSWDQFMLPLPFGRIHFHYGDPIMPVNLAAIGSEEEQAAAVKRRLDELEARATQTLA
jgi:lysophospholipid acyltransferase (LPLAT)-like uncharacterized protein